MCFYCRWRNCIKQYLEVGGPMHYPLCHRNWHNPTSGYIPKGSEIIVSKRHLDAHVNGSIIHNSQEVETTCVHWWMMDKLESATLCCFLFRSGGLSSNFSLFGSPWLQALKGWGKVVILYSTSLPVFYILGRNETLSFILSTNVSGEPWCFNNLHVWVTGWRFSPYLPEAHSLLK